MRADRKTLFARLKTLGIETVTVEHAPTFTVAQSGALRETLPGAHTKSLFVVDKEGRMVLV
ncbi:MAG TPA: prolyl-tRNA synthetase associated domain-containing protein, partial [Novosphingobium sp.]|nr:prolyl-tRNA synthetase associated domain-containing protein [Novosphingobium sp.]